ncbi:hypothetical protein [Curtobacterium herbarum]|uniref:Integral membrane protein n=1 Tax=Curtobacterium herbarum TaxID=150122 RepID=A0ABP4K6X7_9MICO|nr:hypothetical protein [Curtobacterium herbarum]MBM7473949.1 hypothetical protein [Curtobacterium herbarum]MCS6544724.1 hypothetical protein [Curtobacterium herbarum]
MGETGATVGPGPEQELARARKARARKLRKRRELRRVLRLQMDWRGRTVPLLGWWVALLAVASGLLYGSAADPGDLGVAGLPVALTGIAGGVAWGALVVAAAPPLIGIPVVVVSYFVGALTFGPAVPGALSAGTVGMVAGWMVGIQVRWILVGRRRRSAPPWPQQQLVDRSRPRRPAPITRSERPALVSSGVASVGLLVFSLLFFVLRAPSTLPTWLLLVTLALAWAVPTGWWSGMTESRYAVGGAPFVAAQWGILFNAWGAVGVHGLPVSVTAGMAGTGLGFVARRLYDARVGRHPRQRQGSTSSA